MTRGPDEPQEPQVKGGKAAERLRQFLAARFGDDAPPIPPDEADQQEQSGPSSESDDDEGSGQN